MILRHFYAGRRNEMTCQHEVIQTYYLEDTGAPAGLWACTECKTKFVPITELAAEQPTKEWWLQCDLVKKGWGPFESEAAAWRHLFGRDPCAEDIRQHEEAGWYVGFINKWPNAQAQGEAQDSC